MLSIPFSLAPPPFDTNDGCLSITVQASPFRRASLSEQLSHEFITYYRMCPRLLLTKQQVHFIIYTILDSFNNLLNNYLHDIMSQSGILNQIMHRFECVVVLLTLAVNLLHFLEGVDYITCRGGGFGNRQDILREVGRVDDRPLRPCLKSAAERHCHKA